MLAPHDYDRYRILGGGISRADLNVSWAEVDGQRVQLVTAPPVPSNARLTVLRRLAEREALAVDGAAHYLAGGVDERRTWLALSASDGPTLHELAGWVSDRRELGSPDLAARIVADLAPALREVMKRAPSLPASGIGDARVGPDGRVELGQLGEVLSSPRLDERELVVELGGWLNRLCGRLVDPVEDISEKAMSGGIRYLVDLAEELERRMDELGPPPRSRVGNWARHMVEEHPPIAPPTLVDEYAGDHPVRAAVVQAAPTPLPAPVAAAGPTYVPEGSGAAPMVGVVLGGKYRVVGRIANGMMGRIYEATRLDDYKRVAIKLLLPREDDDFDTMAQRNARFRREAESLAKLNHPNIVRVYDYGVQPEVWLAMEFVDGPTLARILKTRTHLEIDEVLVIARKLCSALAHAHAHGVVHRDLKPANIILASGDPAQVRLVDFGLAKDFDGTDNLTNEGTLLGTPHYMSPEQCNGEPQRVESDLYALGMLMFRLLTGRMPFEGKKGVGILLAHTRDPVPRFDSLKLTFSIPPQIEHVVRKCLEKKPENRYRSADELDRALASCQDPAAAGAFAALSRSPSISLPPVLLPVMAAAAVLLLTVGVASTFGVMWLVSRAGGSDPDDATQVVAPPPPSLGSVGPAPGSRPVSASAAQAPEPAPVELPVPAARPAPQSVSIPVPVAEPAPAPAPAAAPAPAPRPARPDPEPESDATLKDNDLKNPFSKKR